MRLSYLLIVFLALIITTAILPSPLPAQTLAIVNVSVIDGSGARPRAPSTLVIREGSIVALGDASEVQVPADANVVDGTGQFLIPGLWDMHVHTISEDFEPGPALEDLLILYLANGITGVREMGYYSETTLTLKRRVASGELLGPRMVIGAMVDGSPPDWPFGIPVSTPEAAGRLVRSLESRGFDFVKAYSMLSREAYIALAEEARAQGLPLVGHVPVTVSAREAAEAGQSGFEHLGDLYAMGLACSSAEAEARARILNASESPRELVSTVHAAAVEALDAYDPEKCRALVERLAELGVWQTPTLHAINVISARAAGDPPSLDERAGYLHPTIRDFWAAHARAPANEVERAARLAYLPIYQQILREMLRAGVPMLVGTDSPVPGVYPGFSLHDELAALVDIGMSPAEALQAATTSPAEFLGLADELGTIAVGKSADLVLLRANPLQDIRATREIEAVISQGRLFTRRRLNALLEGVRQRSIRISH